MNLRDIKTMYLVLDRNETLALEQVFSSVILAENAIYHMLVDDAILKVKDFVIHEVDITDDKTR